MDNHWKSLIREVTDNDKHRKEIAKKHSEDDMIKRIDNPN